MRRLSLLKSDTTQTPAIDADASDAHLAASAPRDPAAFGILFDRHFDAVFQFCFYRLGDWHAAEDAASQVFTTAFASIDRFAIRNDTDSFRAWLLGIAHHTVGKAYRYSDRHPTTPLGDALDHAGPSDSVETMVLDAERREQLRTLLDQLPANQVEVIELRLAGFSAIQIAETLGKSPEAVRKAQSRALFTLRDLLVQIEPTETERHHG
jgi:RNA polymerase sigma-70 factor (ECF subfamily)